MSGKGKLYFVTFLTFVRFPLVLAFLAGALVYAQVSLPWVFVLAFTCLIVSAATDLLDGYFARRLDVETHFGAHADPLMDKFFALSTLPLLVFVSTKNAYSQGSDTDARIHAVFLLILTLLLLVRDQWVTFLRSIGSLYNVSANANWSGKLRTCINFPLICAIYHFEESPWPLINAGCLYLFEALAVGINIVSLYIYTRRYWPSLRRSAALRKRRDKT